jgi:sugar lactone lactonase YvrE
MPTEPMRTVGLAFDSSGNLYVGNNTHANNPGGYASMVTPAGVVSTFATGFNSPEGLTFDRSGNLYVAEYYTGTISMVGPGGGAARTAQFCPGLLLGVGLHLHAGYTDK